MPAPNFSVEMEQFSEVEKNYRPTSDWDHRCDNWIEDVRLKLYSWNPRYARRFMMTSILEASGPDFMLDESPTESSRLRELQRMHNRLERILDPSRKRQWLSCLLGL